MMGSMTNETTTCHCNSQPLYVSFQPFARDERLDRIDDILELLLESRFGYGLCYDRIEMPHFFPAFDDFVNYDLMPKGSGPSSLYSGRTGDQVGVAQCAEGQECTSVTPAIAVIFLSPFNLARGSPPHRPAHVHLSS
jgi:hypothetical protein